MFQFTHPCGCDQVFIKQANAVEGFNSRTRVGATEGEGDMREEDLVSIHADHYQ